MTAHPPLLFLDVETLGLGDAPVWEVAAIRVETDRGGKQSGLHFHAFVRHDEGNWLDTLPDSFAKDYLARFDDAAAQRADNVVERLRPLAEGATVCGSNVGFDMDRVERLAKTWGLPTMPWHYHPEDIPTLARGWLYGRGVFPAPPWKSDLISQMCGVDPKQFDRHTAMGDCSWMRALWSKVSR